MGLPDSDKWAVVTQLVSVVMDREGNIAVEKHAVVPSDNNIKKEEHEKLKE